MSAVLKEQAIESGLIDPVAHEMLLADIQGVLRQANIPERFVWTPIRDYCNEDEIDYVSTLKDSEAKAIGMVYIGNIEGASVNDRMMSIAGTCLRNYINAKVMTVQDVIHALKNDSMPSNVSVLLIPNFFIGKKGGGKIANWEISALLGMLYKRQQEGKKTILYVSNKKALEAEYGKTFINHLDGKFVPIKH